MQKMPKNKRNQGGGGATSMFITEEAGEKNSLSPTKIHLQYDQTK
jgi:hypothetical protein